MTEHQCADVAWRKSESSNMTDCVEVACSGEGVMVRNSREPDGLVVRSTRAEFRAFIEGVKAGELDGERP